MAENRLKPDLLVEIGPSLMVTSLSPKGHEYMTNFWADRRRTGTRHTFVLPEPWLYPLMTSLTEQDLMAVVRRGRG